MVGKSDKKELIFFKNTTDVRNSLNKYRKHVKRVLINNIIIYFMYNFYEIIIVKICFKRKFHFVVSIKSFFHFLFIFIFVFIKSVENVTKINFDYLKYL